jgi:hypothetical protein
MQSLLVPPNKYYYRMEPRNPYLYGLTSGYGSSGDYIGNYIVTEPAVVR